MKACVDIGGTKVAVSLAQDNAREFVFRHAQPTAKQGPDDAVGQQVLQMIDEACAQVGVTRSAVSHVGVSAAGPFEIHDGCVELATPNICGGIAGPGRGLPNQWKTARVEAPLKPHFQCVRVANDAVAALAAERRWGALQGLDHCAYVTWSTGIGVGLCVDGHVLRGKNGNAGHAGHSFTSDLDNSALCGCGNLGDVEGLVSGSAIARRFDRDASELFGAASQGDAQALQITDSLCRVLGRMLFNLVVTLDVQAIALGGSVFWHQQALLMPRLRAALDGRLTALMQGVQLLPAGLGLAVGDYAALALVADEVLSAGPGPRGVHQYA